MEITIRILVLITFLIPLLLSVVALVLRLLFILLVQFPYGVSRDWAATIIVRIDEVIKFARYGE